MAWWAWLLLFWLGVTVGSAALLASFARTAVARRGHCVGTDGPR
jgi:hypothetical protein